MEFQAGIDTPRSASPHFNDLVNVEHLRGRCHLAGGVTGERFADEVGVVERLFDLADGKDVEAMNEVHP